MKKDTDIVDLHLQLPRKLRLAFKLACLRQGLTMQENVAKMMQKYIEWEKEKSAV